MQRVFYILILSLLSATCWATVTTDENGWTEVASPPSGGGAMWYCADATDDSDGMAVGLDTQDGRDPWGFSASCTYTHSSRTLTTTGDAFANFTLSADDNDKTNFIGIIAETGGMVVGTYRVESKTDSNNLVLAADSRLTADATGVTTSAGPKLTTQAATVLSAGTSDCQTFFKRGDTWTDQRIWLGSRIGLSADEPMLWGAYGPQSGSTTVDDRPKIMPDGTVKANMHGVRFDSGTYQYLRFHHLYFEPNNRTIADDAAAGFACGVLGTGEGDIHIEGCCFVGFNKNLDIEGGGYSNLGSNITLHRCGSFDAWDDTAHAQGIFTKYIDGLTITECLFDRNGWDGPELTARKAGSLDHNLYISNGTYDVLIRDCVSSRSQYNGIKLDTIDTTGTVYGNCIPLSFNIAQLGVGEESGYGNGGDGTTTTGNFIYFYDNVASENHTGIHPQNVAGGYIRNNIFNVKQASSGTSPTIIKYTEDTLGVGYVNFDTSDNILYDTQSSVEISDLNGSSSGTWSNCTYADNHMVEPNTAKPYTAYDTGGTAMTFSGNNWFSTNTSDPANRFRINGSTQTTTYWTANHEATATYTDPSAGGSPDWPDPTRTVTRYADEVLGGLTYDELAALWKLERKGNLNSEYHSEEINTWIKQGFGLGDPDVTAPQFVSATLTGTTTLTVSFDEWVDSTDETGFTLSASGGAVTLTMTGFSGANLTFTTSRTIYDNETLTLSYSSAAGDVADSSDNALGDLTSESVTNSSSASGAGLKPVLMLK